MQVKIRRPDSSPVIIQALLCFVLMGTGCVSKKIEPADIPRVSTSQNSEGLVTLSWPSKKGYQYRLLVLNMKTREWQPVAGSKIYEGTGDTITVQDQQNPHKQLPWYSVRPEKIAK